MKHDCDICRGNGVIKLPVYRPASVHYEALPMPMAMEESSRTYACPECSRKVPEHKVMIVGAQTSVASWDVEKYRGQVMQAVQGNLANMLAHQMMKDGLIEFSEREGSMDNVHFRATVGVVSKASVATIEQRATEKMVGFLDGVLEAAAESISVWGRAYTGHEGFISKGMAIGFVSTAFKEAVDKTKAALKD